MLNASNGIVPCKDVPSRGPDDDSPYLEWSNTPKPPQKRRELVIFSQIAKINKLAYGKNY